MPVPTWERSESRTEYLRRLQELNVRMGQIVVGKPKKYRQNYGDELIKTCLQAMKYAQSANSIYIRTAGDFALRRNNLQMARGLLESIPTMTDIFLDLCEKEDGDERRKILKQKQEVGDACNVIIKLIGGVMDHDAKKFKEYK